MVIAALLRRMPSFTQTNTEPVASFTASRVDTTARSWLVEVGVPARTRLVRTLWTLKQPRVMSGESSKAGACHAIASAAAADGA